MRPIQCASEGGVKGLCVSVCVCVCVYLHILGYNGSVCVFVSVQYWYISRFALSSKQRTGPSVSVPAVLNRAVCSGCCCTQTTKLHGWAAEWYRASRLVLPCLERLKQEGKDLFYFPSVSAWKIFEGSVGLVVRWGGGSASSLCVCFCVCCWTHSLFVCVCVKNTAVFRALHVSTPNPPTHLHSSQGLLACLCVNLTWAAVMLI